MDPSKVLKGAQADLQRGQLLCPVFSAGNGLEGRLHLPWRSKYDPEGGVPEPSCLSLLPRPPRTVPGEGEASRAAPVSLPWGQRLSRPGRTMEAAA